MFESPILNDIVEKSQQKDNTFVKEVLKDFWTCCISREASLLARREVLTGKAKFGITGDGKEVPQVALARAFRKGDWRSGYYRDQTLMFALGISTVEEFFAQLYADSENDPFSGGRQMNSHFATPNIDPKGKWTAHREHYNVSSDVSCTGGQMARGLGLALASKKYRESELLRESTPFSENGNEVCFITIGDASTSEGVFWETVNAAGVQKVPLAISVWDDGYGISVPIEFQTTKVSISEVLQGFQLDEQGRGIELYRIKGWDYPALCEAYEKGIEKMRQTHIPALFHIDELTQPQGHSTSGSHARYKSAERLDWERDRDCIVVMGQWIVDSELASPEEVERIREEARGYVRKAKQNAWKQYIDPLKKEAARVQTWIEQIAGENPEVEELQTISGEFKKLMMPLHNELVAQARRVSYWAQNKNTATYQALREWLDQSLQRGRQRYNSRLYSEDQTSALRVPVIPPQYAEDAPQLNGYQILNQFFDRGRGPFDHLTSRNAIDGIWR